MELFYDSFSVLETGHSLYEMIINIMEFQSNSW